MDRELKTWEGKVHALLLYKRQPQKVRDALYLAGLSTSVEGVSDFKDSAVEQVQYEAIY